MDIPTLEYISKELENRLKELEELDFSILKIGKINEVLEMKIQIQQLIFKELTK
jgi:hypothetical protein